MWENARLNEKLPHALSKGPSVSLVGDKVRTYYSNDHNISWVLENENGQRAIGKHPHTVGEMVFANEKGLLAAGRDRRVIENSRLHAIKKDPLVFL
jgi:hypothetical protein